MERPAGGAQHIEAARHLLRTAKTAYKLRRAQHPDGDAQAREDWKNTPALP